MGRHKKPTITHSDEEVFTYLFCEHTDEKNVVLTKKKKRIGLPYCELRCKHKCERFIAVPKEEIDRNLQLLIDRSNESYNGAIEEVSLNKTIYDKCILCAKTCKKEGVGILIACKNWERTANTRISQKMREKARHLLDKDEENLKLGISFNVVKEEPEEDKPKKKSGRPKGSKNKTKKEKLDGRGRPKKKGRKKGSKNKKTKRPVGRPKGSKAKKKGVNKDAQKQKETRKATQKKDRKQTVKKGTSNKAAVKKQTTKSGQRKTPGVVEGIIKSIRKVRGKKSYWITLMDGKKFQSNNRITKDVEIIQEIGAGGLEVTLTVRNKKIASIDAR